MEIKTIYDLLENISKILLPNDSEILFDYFIHSTRRNGMFIRSNYSYSTSVIKNEEIGQEIKAILISFQNPMFFKVSTDYSSKERLFEQFKDFLKIQLHLEDLSNESDLKKAIRRSRAAGFTYSVFIDLDKKSYKILE